MHRGGAGAPNGPNGVCVCVCGGGLTTARSLLRALAGIANPGDAIGTTNENMRREPLLAG
jgi:hypothetical protein